MYISKVESDRGYFDSHCHLDHLDDLSQKLADAIAQNIQRFFVPATSTENWPDLLALKSDRIAIGLGTHPWFVKHAEQEARALSSALSTDMSNRINAIGEIGLDFYISETKPRPARTLQIDSFNRQLAIAKAADLPVIIHSVKAHAEVLTLLKKHDVQKGVIHAFSGSVEQAREFVKQGFMLGIGPIILKSKKTQDAVAALSLDRVMIETDAPYVHPRLEGSNPLFVLLIVAEKLAQLKSASLDEVQQQTQINAKRLFY